MNGRILWTIGDSIFHINRDMVSAVAEVCGMSLVSSDFSGASVSPCRLPEICAVNLIKNGTFDNMFTGAYAPEVILLQRGVNDLYESCANGKIPVGDVGDRGERTSLFGAVNCCTDYFRTKFPSARIIWCAPLWSAATSERVLAEYTVKLRAYCASHGTEYLDVYGKSGIDRTNYKEFLYDGTHPNDKGKKRLAHIFSKAVGGII